MQPIYRLPLVLYVPIYSVLSALYDAYTLKADTQGDTKGGITDASFRSVLNDFSEASEQRVSQSMKLKKACTTGISVLWLTQEVELCPKLGKK